MVNDMTGSPDPFVCFVHGLEGTPQGAKVVGMRAQGLEVMAPDMHMSVWNVRRKNSAVRSMLRLPEVRALGIAGFACGVLSVRKQSAWPLAAWGLGVGAFGLARKDQLARRGLARSFDVSLDIVARDVLDAKPDVIVGSSWGGAVCMELVRRGVIDAPLILLAPAYRKIGEYLGWGDVQTREAELRACLEQMHVEIFHDPTDDVVPFQHSRDLVRGTRLTLHEVHAGGHSLLGLIDDGLLSRTIRAIGELPAT